MLEKMKAVLENTTPAEADAMKQAIVDRMLQDYLSTVTENLEDFDSDMTLAQADTTLEGIIGGLPELLSSKLVTADPELIANKVGLFDYLIERFGGMPLFKGEKPVAADDEPSR
eukprot:Trichotokara_eunicae@DN2207_c0_g1_i2.p1